MLFVYCSASALALSIPAFQTMYTTQSARRKIRPVGASSPLYKASPEENVVDLICPKDSSFCQVNTTVAAEISPSRQSCNSTKKSKSSASPEYVSNPFPRNSTQQARATTPTGAFPVTPCTRICRYNANFYEGQVCIGCFREAYEIRTWASMSGMEKSLALLDAVDRIDQDLFDGALRKEELLEQSLAWARERKE
jgi:predicted Fe-S protein YdhL (DUF1289 family)